MAGKALGRARRAELVEELHEHDLRATPARLAVLDAVRRLTSPVTHGELAQSLGSGGWDAATIYRNLMTLVDAGLVARTDHGDRRWRFEPVAARIEHEHPHFFCTDCGGVTCLPGVQLRVTRSAEVPRSVSAKAHDVQLRGVCDDCDPA